MNIRTVADNLRKTIANKELLLSQMIRDLVAESDRAKIIALDTSTKFLQININELKLILADVESCMAKEVEQSWRDNPDRMGGQFTQEEIDNASAWR